MPSARKPQSLAEERRQSSQTDSNFLIDGIPAKLELEFLARRLCGFSVAIACRIDLHRARMKSHESMRIAVLLFSDLVGSVALQGRVGTQAYSRMLARHNEIFRQAVELEGRGHILNYTGDGFLAELPSPTDAVNAALRFQWLLNKEPWEAERLVARTALHLGEIAEMEQPGSGEVRHVGMAVNPTTAGTGGGNVTRQPSQTLYPFGSTVRLSAVPALGSFFRNWVGLPNAGDQFLSPIALVVTNTNPIVTARFNLLPANIFALTTLIQGEGAVTKSPQQSNYVSGATVTLNAAPAAGFHFLHWTNDATGAVNPLPVLMTASKTVTAVFESDSALNVPPVTAILSPAAGAVFTAPTQVTINASASDPDGTVSEVAFFAGLTRLGAVTAPPFTFVWNASQAGSYDLTSVVTDNRGASVASAPVSITVNPKPNDPPVVALLQPMGTEFFRQPTNILFVAQATDDEIVARVDFFGTGVLLGSSTEKSETNTFAFTWTNAPSGTHPIFVRAVDNKNASTSTLPIDITVLEPEKLSFRWATAILSVGENDRLAVLTIFKAGLQEGSISYLAEAASAIPGKDFVSAQGTVSFQAAENSKTVSITLLNEFVPDGEKTFEVRLVTSNPDLLGSPSICRVVIADDDASLADSSFFDWILAGDRPATRGRLQMHLEPSAADGQWRFPWELAWRNSGELAADLDPGEYPVEFRARANYRAPTPVIESVPGGSTVVRTNVYALDPSLQSGSLTVELSPIDQIASLAPGWRFLGESAFHAPGQTLANVLAGSRVIEFRPIPGWVRPAAREVLIQAGVRTTVTAAYTLDSPPVAGVEIPRPIGTYAAIHTGQGSLPPAALRAGWPASLRRRIWQWHRGARARGLDGGARALRRGDPGLCAHGGMVWRTQRGRIRAPSAHGPGLVCQHQLRA